MDIATTVKHLENLEWRPDTASFDLFASTIVLNDQQDIRIVFRLVDHYLDYGNLRKAAKILTACGRLEASPTVTQLEDLDETLLAISRARLQIRRSVNTRAALDLKRRLDTITIFDIGAVSPDGTEAEKLHEDWIRFKLHRSLLWVDLRRTGHLATDALTEEVESWIGRAIGYLRVRNDVKARRLEFAILANFHTSSLNQQQQWLESLISRCADRSLEKIQATRLYALSTLGTSRLQAMSKLEDCKSYFVSTGNVAAELDLELIEIATDTRIAEKVTAYLGLGKRCFDLGLFRLAKSCLDQAERSTRNLANRWATFESLSSLAMDIFDKTEDVWSANEFKVARCCARAFSSPRDPTDQHMAIEMLETLRNERSLTSSQNYSIWSVLGDCANQLMKYDLLDECERVLMNHEYTKLDYEKESLIIRDYSLSTHTRIAARYRQNLTEAMRREAYEDLQRWIEKLEESFDRDRQHRLSDLAKIKLQRLIFYYNTIDIEYPERRLSAKISKRSCYSRYAQYRDLSPNDTLIQMFAIMDGFLELSTLSSIEIADQSLQAVRADSSASQMQHAEAYLLCAISRKVSLDTKIHQENQFLVLQDVMTYLSHSREATDLADSSGIFLQRITTTLLSTAIDLILLDNSNKAEYFKYVRNFLVDIETAITRQRGPSTANTDLTTFMENRRLELGYIRRNFYREAEDFFFRMNCLGDWWAWHERARNRTLNSRLSQLHGGDSLYQLPIDGAESEEMFSRLFANAAEMDPTGSLVIVDFHISPKGNLFFVIISSKERKTQVVDTKLTREFIETWHNRVMDDPVDRLKDPSYLVEMQSLAAAVLAVTTEENLICFIPPYPLDRLPLHAACIEGKYLLERNPIIHATSLVSLCHCFEVSRSARAPRLDKSVALVSVYDVEEEQKRILSSQQTIYNTLRLASLPIGQVKKARFRQILQEIPWVHYHGHVTSLANGPLDQGFVLYDGVLTVQDIMNEGSLEDSAVIVIGCSSGAQDNNQANEQLGLSPILLNAGAMTVLSTLWNIESHAGRIFSEKFYERIHDQLKEAKQDEHFINVAQALKHAIDDLRNYRGNRLMNVRFTDANHWAAYIMHGSPFFKVKGCTQQGKTL